MPKKPRFKTFLVLLISAFLFGGCSTTQRSYTYDIPAVQQPFAVAGALSTLQTLAADNPAYHLRRYDLPDGFLPIGMVNEESGYLFDAERQGLYRYAFDGREPELIYPIATEAAADMRLEGLCFDEDQLVLSLSVEQSEGRRAILRLLTPRGEAIGDLALESYGSAEAYPFTQLKLSNGLLLYRSVDATGRFSRVCLIDTQQQDAQTRIIAEADRQKQLRIGSCDIDSDSVIWETRRDFHVVATGLPTLPQSRSTLSRYRLHDGAVETLGEESIYFSPVLREGAIYAVELLPIEWLDGGYDTNLVRIDADKSEMTRLPNGNTAVFAFIEAMEAKGLARNLLRSEPRTGLRFLSWHSNYPERQLIYDLQGLCYTELPLLFSSAEANDPQCISRQFLPGLDADYWLFCSTINQERYILRTQ